MPTAGPRIVNVIHGYYRCMHHENHRSRGRSMSEEEVYADPDIDAMCFAYLIRF